jgi:RNA-directed DNA polymerase
MRQQRIERASRRGEGRTVRTLQRLWMQARAARVCAVRTVTQAHPGKPTAGIDGVKALTPPPRLARLNTWWLGQKAKPVRRVWMPPPDTTAQRP